MLERFPDLSAMRVLDLGGRATTWAQSSVLPKEVVILNASGWDSGVADGPGEDDNHLPVRLVVGDACSPPADIMAEHFDLVYSNSVIEHLGGHSQRKAFADVVRTLGDHHWVQTPYRYFPVEPHWVFPGMQFLPVKLQAEISSRWPLGWAQLAPEMQFRDHVEMVLEVELLSISALSHYFPESAILIERLAKLPKSLVATS